MQLPKELTTVTTISKIVALIMFITLPIIAFLFGMRYQTLIEQANSIPSTPVAISPTTRPKLISPTMTSKDVFFCGGIAGKTCPNGYYCKYDGTYHDAGGTCIKTIKTKTDFTCPINGWVNCMPILNEKAKKGCSKEAVVWYKAYCPDFKGTAN